MLLRRPELTKIARIDMTPMAGVLICLLILFFVLTPIGCGVCVELPLMSARWLKETPDRAGNLNVGVDNRGRLYFKGKRLEGGLDDLAEALRVSMSEPDAEERVLLKADVSRPFREIRVVMDVCRNAGIRSIALVTQPRPDDSDIAAAERILAALSRF